MYGKINETKIIQGAQRLFFSAKWWKIILISNHNRPVPKQKYMLYKGSIRIGRDGLKRTETFFSKMLD